MHKIIIDYGAVIISIALIIAMFISINSIPSPNDTVKLTPIPFVRIITSNQCEDFGVSFYPYGVGRSDCFELECRFTSMDGRNWEFERCNEIR
jgi:hypothetical protein